jgi:hypothetical protein
MDEYGLATWDENGVQQIGPASFTLRTVFSTLVTFSGAATGTGISQTFSVPGVNPQNCIAVVVPIGPYTTDQHIMVQYEPEILTDQIRVWRGHRTAFEGQFGTGIQRLIVSRFK